MIKLAYNKEKENLVFMIDKIEREGMTTTGIIEKYTGTLVDTDNDNAKTENYKESVIAFDSYWVEVPTAICNLIDDVRNQNKTITPTTSSQEVTADSGYTGLGTVTVSAVTAAIDANIVAENIKKDVTILGVTGTYEA